jgi:hypothetical protein
MSTRALILLMLRLYPWFDETEVPSVKLMLDNQMKYHGKMCGGQSMMWVGYRRP